MSHTLVDLELARSILREKPSEKPDRGTLIMHADRILQFESVIQMVRDRIRFVVDFMAQCDANVQALDGAKTEFSARVKDAPDDTAEWLDQLLPLLDCKPEIFGLHTAEILTTMNACRARIAELREYLIGFFNKEKLQRNIDDFMGEVHACINRIHSYEGFMKMYSGDGTFGGRIDAYKGCKLERDETETKLREVKKKLRAAQQELEKARIYQESDQADVEKAFDEVTACRRQIRECAASCFEKFNVELETYQQVLDKLILIIRSV